MVKLKGLFAALLLIAACTTPDKKVDRPSIDAGRVDTTWPDDQCGDSSPGCPRDSIAVDSSQASIFRLSSWESEELVAVDSSLYKFRWRVSGFTTGDTVQIKLVRDSVAGKVTRVSITKNRFTTNDSVSIGVDKVYGTKAKYSWCVRLRRTAVKSELCQEWFTNFASKPSVDTMSVDSSLALAKLDVKPDKVDLKFGQKQQFCAYIVFLDGKVALRTRDKGTPECDEMYKQFSLAKRDITIKQQQRADSVCIKWSATGGNITAEVCDPSNPLVGHQL